LNNIFKNQHFEITGLEYVFVELKHSYSYEQEVYLSTLGKN